MFVAIYHELIEEGLAAHGVPADEVPLAFLNIDTKLTQEGHDYWAWQGCE